MRAPSRPPSAPGGATLVEEPSDEELLRQFRAGDEAAFEELYRRHEAVARKAATCLVRTTVDAHDVVADAFLRILTILRRGGGPDTAFRPYLLACVRNAAYDRCGRRAREAPSDELPSPEPDGEDPVAASEDQDLILAALRTLPERWRLVLWYTAVEARKPAEIAPLLDLTPNGVAALAYRARDGLREAYLQAHLQHRAPIACRPTVARLGAHVRGTLARRERRAVSGHLARCEQCRALVRELRDVDRRLQSAFLPAAGSLPAVVSFLSRLGAGASRLAERAGEIAAGITTPVAAGIAAGSVAVTGAIGVTILRHEEPGTVVAAVAPAGGVADPAPLTTTTTTPSTTRPTSPTTSPTTTITIPPTTVPATAPASTRATEAAPTASVPATTAAAALPSTTTPPTTAGGSGLPLPTVSVSLPTISVPAVSLPPITLPSVPLPIVSTLPPLPQLRVQAGLQGLALPGLEATLRVSVGNSGTGPAIGPSVQLPLPAGLAFVSASGPGWSCGGGSTVTCQLPDLTAGASTSATIRVRIGLLVSGILQLVPIVDATNAVSVVGPALALAIGG